MKKKFYLFLSMASAALLILFYTTLTTKGEYACSFERRDTYDITVITSPSRDSAFSEYLDEALASRRFTPLGFDPDLSVALLLSDIRAAFLLGSSSSLYILSFCRSSPSVPAGVLEEKAAKGIITREQLAYALLLISLHMDR